MNTLFKYLVCASAFLVLSVASVSAEEPSKFDPSFWEDEDRINAAVKEVASNPDNLTAGLFHRWGYYGLHHRHFGYRSFYRPRFYSYSFYRPRFHHHYYRPRYSFTYASYGYSSPYYYSYPRTSFYVSYRPSYYYTPSYYYSSYVYPSYPSYVSYRYPSYYSSPAVGLYNTTTFVQPAPVVQVRYGGCYHW